MMDALKRGFESRGIGHTLQTWDCSRWTFGLVAGSPDLEQTFGGSGDKL
jgi:hypothetical protein